MKAEEFDGYSKSAWKSLAVKSLRMGWPNGLVRAQTALGQSEIKGILLCGVFEDVFPAVSEFPATLDEVRRLDYAALCQRETHHGRGHTARFCALEPQAVAIAKARQHELWAAARPFSLWLPPRSLNCWWTWLEIAPGDAGATRTVDMTPWAGMPSTMLDGHTLEGKRAGTAVTLLSGHYHQHARLAEIIHRHGWTHIRQQVHSSTAPVRATLLQGDLFGV